MEDKTKKVLIIEDSENILSLLEAMLSSEGFQIETRENIYNIVHHLKQDAPDLILMDMLLSGANGCDACRDIKMTPELNHIPIVMMSAHPSGELDCGGAGADYFVSKPFEMEELLDIIKKSVSIDTV